MELAVKIGLKSACAVLKVPHSQVYRQRQTKVEAQARPTPAHALSTAEKAIVRETLNSERFMEQAPRQVYATLLDEGTYLCHWRTMYRILAAHDEVHERRLLRPAPRLQETGITGNSTEPGVVMGHYLSARGSDLDTLPALHCAGYFQPLCRWLDDC